MATHKSGDQTIYCEELDEVWFEYAVKRNGLIALMTWNLAEIADSDMILGTEVEDLACGIELDKEDIKHLKELCEFILITYQFGDKETTE